MLSSKNIFLRTLQPYDTDDISKWENDSKNWKVSGTIKPFTKAEIESFVNAEHNINLNKQIRYVICLNSTQKAIGTVDLFEYDTQNKILGVGILIAELTNRNKGYASESLGLIIDYCRNELRIVNLFCNILKDNATSIRLFENLGFQFVEECVLFENEVNYYELKL